MAITRQTPNAIHLGGPFVLVDDLVAGVAITPGMIVETYDDSGVNKWRPHASADEQPSIAVAINAAWLNKAITDDYAIGDLTAVHFLQPGSTFWAIIPSGQDISNAELLQSNGDGKLKAAGASTAGANVARFQSLDNPGSVNADTRIRAQVIC